MAPHVHPQATPPSLRPQPREVPCLNPNHPPRPERPAASIAGNSAPAPWPWPRPPRSSPAAAVGAEVLPPPHHHPHLRPARSPPPKRRPACWANPPERCGTTPPPRPAAAPWSWGPPRATTSSAIAPASTPSTPAACTRAAASTPPRPASAAPATAASTDLNGTVTQGPAPVGAILQHYQVSESTPGGVLVIDPSKPVSATTRLT